ncbi:hypothetical protein [Rhizobium sp. LjRoot258]|jgi:hypothetical protein|uniref:hypothetical protein n=1 Tax=Rhizobium sp. LjRoot258 TaxID=3342299 RepID=UPI003ECCFEBD
MLKDKITKPASFGRTRNGSANENRPIASPSAEELIVQASDARAMLRSGHGDTLGNFAAEVQLPTEEFGGFEVESKTSLLEEAPHDEGA